MVVGFNYDDTTTDVNTDDGTWHRINVYCKEDDYKEDDYIDRDILEWMRQGWFNPRKTPVNHQVLNRRHNKVIRSQLPQRIRINQPKEII